MRTPQVGVRAGSGFDLLVSAVAVADGNWRGVLTEGPAVYATVRAAGGTGLVRDAARFGRFGWINLIGALATSTSKVASRGDLGDLLASMRAPELHYVLAGGLRAQLVDRVAPSRLRAALRGNAIAEQEVKQALRSPTLLVEISRWLLETRSSIVRDSLLRTVSRWPDLDVGSDEGRPTLSERGASDLVERVTPGIRYGPAVLDRVLLVDCPLVAPIVLWVDQPDVTVIVHPPVDGEEVDDTATLLRRQGNALGDETRVQLLLLLRGGSRTLAELCSALGRPRTTLLHHLALLRASGFVTLAVTANEPNVYHLDRRGFDTLARAAKGFVID